jgi:hypothetical protein
MPVQAQNGSEPDSVLHDGDAVVARTKGRERGPPRVVNVGGADVAYHST